MKLNKQSFSLIEVIIFVAILSLFFVTGMAVVVYSLQTMKTSQHKMIATQYAQQLATWIKTQKETDWKTFISHSSTVGISFCFKTSPIPDWPSVGTCGSSDYINVSPPIFIRSVTLTSDSDTSPSKVDIDILLSWNEANNTYSVPLNTIVSRFE